MRNPGDILLQIVVFALAISAHESAHAYMAKRCGDPTAARKGRISLNPLVHVDLFGTVLLPALLIYSGAPVFGWARPVPVNPNNLNNRSRDAALVSIAGPLTNVSLVVASLLLTVVLYPFFSQVAGLFKLLRYNTIINTVLAVFNLLPVPPLDGAGIFKHFASRELERWLTENRFIIFIGFMLLWIMGVLQAILGFFINFVLTFQKLLLVAVWG